LLLFINNIRKSPLVSVLSITAFSTIIKIITSFFVAKIISIYLGPTGLGITGQLAGFIAIVTVFSSGGINNGTVKYLAEHKFDEYKINRVIKASSVITFICSLSSSFILILGSVNWSIMLFGTSEFYIIIVLFGVFISFYSTFSLINSVLNGLGKIKFLNNINIISNVVNLILCSIMIYFFDLCGALVSMISYQAIIVFFIFVYYRKNITHKINAFKKIKLIKEDYNSLGQFAIMNLIGISCIPVVQIIIRNYIGISINSDTVGYYEAINRVSIISITVISNTLTLYYLPKLSEIKNDLLLRNEIFSASKVIIPITFFILLSIYLFRKFIIFIVFSNSFLPMENYFLPQMIGDMLRVSGYMLAYQFWAKAMVKKYIVVEVIIAICYFIFTYYLVNIFGGVGVAYAYAITQLVYILLLIFSFRNLLFYRIVRS
jgi:PST family polysaccharide transporter